MTARELAEHQKEVELLARACEKFHRLWRQASHGERGGSLEKVASELTAQMHVVEARIRGLA